MKNLSIFLLVFISSAIFADSAISPIPQNLQRQMRQYTWRQSCPVALDKLAYITVPYWGFDSKPHQGVLIVNKKLATEVLNIFQQLYQRKFPIEKIIPVENYQGDDDKAMEDNDTSAFNCRAQTNHPGVFSLHSYGVAIDINPLLNPYVSRGIVKPAQGKKYLDRNKIYPGMIIKNDFVNQVFRNYGWSWGGSWKSPKDYQHFEKIL